MKQFPIAILSVLYTSIWWAGAIFPIVRKGFFIWNSIFSAAIIIFLVEQAIKISKMIKINY